MSDEILSWDELAPLLAPVHDDVQLFARRIAGSNAEGDDLFQEAVLRAAGCDAPVHPGAAGPIGPVPSAAHADLVIDSLGEPDIPSMPRASAERAGSGSRSLRPCARTRHSCAPRACTGERARC